MKAKVISSRADKRPTIINGSSVKTDDIVDVDANTFRNLARKGILGAVDKDGAAVNLAEPSRLSAAQAQAQIDEQVAAREKKKKQDEAEKAKQK